MLIVVLLIVAIIISLALTKALNIFDSIVIVDASLRVIDFVFGFFNNSIITFLDEYTPNSLLEPIDIWTSGNVHLVFLGVYILCYLLFLYTIIRKLLKRK